MNILQNFRKEPETITYVGVTSADTVNVMIIKKQHRGGIIARFDNGVRLLVWDKESHVSHLSDTKEEFLTKIKDLLEE